MATLQGADKPLSSLIKLALSKYGDAAGHHLLAGDTDLFIMYANDVIREINFHPYHDDQDDLEYYNHEQEKRPIDYLVLVKGMLFYYAQDQGSKRVGMYREDYYRHLNMWLYQMRYGNGPIRSQKFDHENQSL